MDLHSLKKRVNEQFGPQGSPQMQIRIMSFGFKYGTPKNCDIVLDVRFLTNPHFVPELREFTGLDSKVADFIRGDQRALEFTERSLDYLSYLVPHYSTEGKTYLTIGIGCTGGKHRSVFLAEELARLLNGRLKAEYSISVEHQDLRLNPAS